MMPICTSFFSLYGFFAFFCVANFQPQQVEYKCSARSVQSACIRPAGLYAHARPAERKMDFEEWGKGKCV
ncbi:hypothetical protein DM02DRAFT_611212 [Periconia macrospinosa]|uniref:Secreted protein n=1 Tax=Periconia macrospinosa TaxID=97972 RepID=A0A2V1E2V1_9PLEO|nr:hypothetical protein DM02DRAFT_611212 [Periconia macrospinosa]